VGRRARGDPPAARGPGHGAARSRYAATTFSAAVLDPPAGRTLAITFDDACGSVLQRAKPVLDGLGVPATVFAPSGWVGEPTPMRWAGIEQHAAGPHADELACLDWDELRGLADDGWGGRLPHRQPPAPERDRRPRAGARAGGLAGGAGGGPPALGPEQSPTRTATSTRG